MTKPSTARAYEHRLVVLLGSLVSAIGVACATGSKGATGPSVGGTPTNIVKVSGDSQSAPFGAALPHPLVVKVTDSVGAVVTNSPVAWLISLDGASQTQSITNTNSAGLAQIAPLLGGVPGAFTVNAAINGHSVSFTGISNVALASTNIVTGIFNSCGLTTQGAAWCWGDGTAGQLGNGTTAPHTGPVAVSGGLTFTKLSMQTWVVCGLTASGSLYCWGDPSYGNFGNGSAPGGSPVTTPIAAGNGMAFTQVAVGDNQSCGLSTGVAYCWGNNQSGQLGTGDTVHHWSPVAVHVPNGISFTSLVSNSSTSCGLTAAGTAYCWGNNYYGQLGTGSSSTPYSTLPLLVAGSHTFASLSAGTNGVCGLATGGAVYCWGEGANSTAGSSVNVPTMIAGGLTFTEVSFNGQHACGLIASGAGYCWGANDSGDLGTGSFSQAFAGSPVAVTGGLTFSTIVSMGISTCAYATTNVMYCWGANQAQQLGLSATADSMYAAPTPVPGLSQ
jgi:alpha-tubulin suppressor-like RCC1 family protein